MRVRGRGGFTLVEALIALTLASLVLAMVASLMVAQGQYFGDTSRRTELRGTVRSVVEMVRADIQSVTRGGSNSAYRHGITTAEEDRIELRAPLTIGSICRASGASPRSVYLPAPGGGISDSRVSGWGYTEGATDDAVDNWRFTSASWTSILQSGGTPKVDCYNAGLDTVGTGGAFYRVSIGNDPQAGELFALITDVELQFAESELRPGTKALFRREGSGSLVEFANGLSEDSRFEYRLAGETGFDDSVANDLSDIVEVRLTVAAERRNAITGEVTSYEWVARIPLRNVD